MFDYKSLIDYNQYSKLKPIPVAQVSENTIFKNIDLVLPYLAYKFIELPDNNNNNIIPSYIHKPLEVINDDMPEIKIGSRITCKLYNSIDIYSVVYVKDATSLASTIYANFITSAYTVFSNLFVRCKLRYISKEPSYVAFVSKHSPDVLVSLKDIFNRYGMVNDKTFNRRLKQAIGRYNNDNSKSDNKQID